MRICITLSTIILHRLSLYFYGLARCHIAWVLFNTRISYSRYYFFNFSFMHFLCQFLNSRVWRKRSASAENSRSTFPGIPRKHVVFGPLRLPMSLQSVEEASSWVTEKNRAGIMSAGSLVECRLFTVDSSVRWVNRKLHMYFEHLSRAFQVLESLGVLNTYEIAWSNNNLPPWVQLFITRQFTA